MTAAGPHSIGAGEAVPAIHRGAGRSGLAAYRLLTSCASPLAGLILGMRARRGKEDMTRRGERLGIASVPRPPGPLVWIHAASVGEAASVLPLMAALVERRPDLHILLTTGTVTSARFVSARLPPRAIHQYVPLDSPRFAARFLAHWDPALAVFTEQEIWPNLIQTSGDRGIPLVLANARISDRSFVRWHRRSRIAAALFSRFTVVMAQNRLLAERFVKLGARHAEAVGNLKIDAPPPPVDEQAKAALETALAGRPRIVAASTHPGEEEVIAAAHRKLAHRIAGFCTIIAPRHPERGPVIAGMLATRGLKVAQRSLGELPDLATDVYVADTIGELGTLYAIAPVAFVGGSLVPHGGQNPIEAVRHGAVVLAGPSRTNFADSYSALVAAKGAIEVQTAEDIATDVATLLEDPAALAEARARATQALAGLSGALERTVVALLPLIPSMTGDAGRAA
jgi:3-deoxy-D-manno-octulosonic-acid transferase